MNAGVLAFDAAGRITTLSVVDFPSPRFNGGTPTGDLGSLVVTTTGDNYLDGIAYDDAGAIKVAEGSAVVSPTLDFDFTKGTLDKRLTFTRNSPASYVDAQGIIRYAGVNIPRFEAQGLLIEGARTNVLLYSEGFSNGAWIKDNCAVEGGESSPDGGRDGFTVRPTTAGTANRLVRQPYSTSTQGTFAASIYVKRGTIGSNGVTLRVRDNTSTNDARMPFNLVNPIPPVVAASGTWVAGAGAAEPVGDGWYRLTMVFTTNTAYTSLTFEAWLGSYTGTPDTTGTIIVWGAQLETGAFATSYMPTTNVAFTREGDHCTMPIANVPGYTAAQGSLYTSITRYDDNNDWRVAGFGFEDGVGLNDYIQLIYAGVDGMAMEVQNLTDFSGVYIYPTPPMTRLNHQIAGSWDATSTFCAIGAESNTEVGITPPPTMTQLTVGSLREEYYLDGHIQAAQYYPVKLSRATLQNLAATGRAFNFSDGLPISAEGALLVSYDQTPVKWVAGIPLDVNGLVCLATPTPPIDLSGFDSGFDEGFF